MLMGGCMCGYVRYEADGIPFNSTACHCSDCRRATAAPFVAWFSVPPSRFRVVSGEPGLHASSPGVERGFCPRCGTPLTFRRSDLPDELDVATCSLDDPELVPPADHVRTGSRLSWVHLPNDLPAYTGARTGT